MLRGIADTHAVIWYIYDDPRLSAPARATFAAAVLAGDQIGFSTITYVEIIYLTEKGRLESDVLARLLAATRNPRAVLQGLPFTEGIALTLSAVERDKVPDMPDRIITATAQHFQLPLISRDGKIRLSGVTTIW